MEEAAAFDRQWLHRQYDYDQVVGQDIAKQAELIDLLRQRIAELEEKVRKLEESAE